MKVIREEQVDWEPLHIRLSTRGSGIASAIEQEVKQWFARRGADNPCRSGCAMKSVNTYLDGDDIHLLVQWVCDSCLPSLLEVIASSFPQVDKAIVGASSAYRFPKPDRRRFVAVPRRIVTLGDSTKVDVFPFEISSYPISVVQFEEFASRYGYLTSAEMRREPRTYRNNETLFNEERRLTAEARFLSYCDAVAYCKPNACRLPTDTELLAAITVDDTERDITSKERAALFRDSPRLLRLQGITITSTLEGELAVLRSGPWVTKHPGWNEGAKYRLLRRQTDPVGQMYVIKGVSKV
jgi:hypothetical protein